MKNHPEISFLKDCFLFGRTNLSNIVFGVLSWICVAGIAVLLAVIMNLILMLWQIP
jgi:hypothetical protein